MKISAKDINWEKKCQGMTQTLGWPEAGPQWTQTPLSKYYSTWDVKQASQIVCQTPSSIQVFALSCSHGDSSPISESSNTMLPGPQQASLWCLSFCHIAYPIHQKILSSRYNQIPPLLLTSTITTLVQTIIISYLSSYCSLLTGLSTSNFTHHSLCFHKAAWGILLKPK